MTDSLTTPHEGSAEYAKSLEIELKGRTALLQAILDSTADGILVVDSSGKILSYNRRFIELWHISDDVIATKDDEKVLSHVLSQLKNPDGFLGKVKELYGQATAVSDDVLEFNDGRIFERHSQPLQGEDKAPLGRVWSFRDITEKKSSDERIKLSEASLQTIFDAVPAFIFYKNTENHFLHVNRAFSAHMGKPKEELEGKSLFDLYPHDQAEKVWNDDKEVISSGISKVGIIEQLTVKDGELRTIQTDKIPYKDEKGNIVGVIGFAIDITEQKKATDELRQSEKRLDALVQNGNDIITVLAMDGTMTYESPVCTLVTGYEPHELLGKNVMWFVHPMDLPSATAQLANAIVHPGTPHSGTFRFKHKDGSWISLDVVGTYHPEIASINGIVLNSRDVTARMQIEEKIRESEDRYKTLVDSAPLCVKWFDPQGKLLSINKHGREEHFLTGKTDEEIRQWDFMTCVEESYRDAVRDCMKRAAAGSISEIDIEHVPGTTSCGHWCHSNIIPAMDSQGNIKYILFISQDITSAREAERLRQKNIEELEKVNKIMIGRELKMIELKKELDTLKGQSTANV